MQALPNYLHCLLYLLIVSTIPPATYAQPVINAQSQPSSYWFKTWEEVRWQDVVRQTSEHNCGSSSVATALHMLTGDAVSPDDLHPTDEAASLADLRRMLADNGIPSTGLRMSSENLARYLDEQQMPAIAHILAPTPHFTLVTQFADEHFITRDPSQGLTAYTPTEWNQLWTGVALLLLPDHTTRNPDQAAEDEVVARLRLLLRTRTTLRADTASPTGRINGSALPWARR